MGEVERITKTVDMSGEQVEIVMTKMMTPCTQEEFEAMSLEEREHAKIQPALNQRTYSPEEGIICMQDIPVKMRDGVTIYVDIYKPEAEGKYPLIISWSFYGKRPFEGQAEWQIMGVPPHTVSDMSKFESPDPGYWCRHGYAVANVDPRGIGHSEGDFVQFGTQDGKDGYDFIEWAADQDWCNGRCGLAGNSCVAMTQWRIAAQQPPHLACIAPWESTTDMYRESLCEGGIPAKAFVGFVMREACGINYIDNTPLNLEKYPFVNCTYWKDKEPDFGKVKIPVYQTACWNHLHLRGSINAFRKCKSRRKWLRAHRNFEWPDAYSNENIQDLEKFYARYLKLERNGWELTPKVRIEVQDVGEFNYQTNRPEESFPLKRTRYEKLYLDASDNSMKAEPVAGEAKASYDSLTGEVCFDYRFEEEEVKNRMYCGIRGTLNRLAVRGDPGLMELTLRFLENRGLYPYPLRLYRRDGRYTFQHFLADCLSFFYPKKRYLRFCIALRSLLIKRQGDVGILTFHCADNYGALLQACSLRRCICSLGRKADIVRYEPAAVAGGFRWIPYIPGGSRKSVLGRAIRGFRYNLGKAPDFFRRRRCMNQFRNCFLTEGFGFRLRFPGQWKRLPYRDYVIGSDQVWNPQLTGGLQEAYFGFFKNPKKERVISYAASLGSSELASEYNDVFQRLIQNLDRVSLREKEAAGYVSRFFRGPVEICMDPVFLQDRSFWEGLERRPDREQYILVYNVDGNRRLYEYAGELSCKLGLPVVELGLGVWQKPVFWMDYQAGPQEFLGYIHHAECVVTNSFHGIAFSIIFEKRFIGFLHETRGERTRNILKICGLEDRLYEERGGDVYGRGEICWEDVRRRTAEAVRRSKVYLEILKEEDEKE